MDCTLQPARSNRPKRRHHRQDAWSATYGDLELIPLHWVLSNLEECLQLRNIPVKYTPEAPRAMQVRNAQNHSPIVICQAISSKNLHPIVGRFRSFRFIATDLSHLFTKYMRTSLFLLLNSFSSMRILINW
ncbi:unnamed protein product [Echinostoma caproni]|uniref:Uncharacterized protein n=1 Tax=Echinostoma caproni TaxID=27848 RepID=A0A183ASR3_9TREM|nr:unnamed protein product [Echinostoma caproni]